MLYQGIIGGGSSPVEPVDLSPVLLWTNPSPTTEFGAQTVSLDLTEYAGVIVEFNLSTESQVNVSRVYVKKSDNLNPASTWHFGSGSKSNNRGMARGISEINDSGISFVSCVDGVTDNNNSSMIPTKIYGVKEYVVEPVTGVVFGEFAPMAGNTDIDAVVGDYYILESRDTYSTSAASSTTITGADKIIENLDNLTTQKVAIYTTVIKATSSKFRCDKPGYYSHITLN